MRQDRAANGSDLLIAALANEGVDRVFGVPGDLRAAQRHPLLQHDIGMSLTLLADALGKVDVDPAFLGLREDASDLSIGF